MTSRDFTDSEPEDQPSAVAENEHSAAEQSGPPSANHSLKVTLRPNSVDHVNPSSSHSGKSKHTMADIASYSSSEDEDKSATATSPPRKKKKLDESSPKQTLKLTVPHGQTHSQEPSPSGEAGVTGPGRKSYDWLQPSIAGASHGGPPDRGVTSPAEAAISSGHATADEAIGGLLDLAMSTKSSSKKKMEGAPGPSKVWRKTVKDKIAAGKSESGGTPNSTPSLSAIAVSREPSPDLSFFSPNTLATIQPASPLNIPRAPSPPFIPADASQLDYPVYSHPIITPKINLSSFPKVTNFFAPYNGGDLGPFPRKDRVRNWVHQEKALMGVGGGYLKFKSWARGPTSDLERAMREERTKEAQAAPQRPPKVKGGATSTSTSTPQPIADSTFGNPIPSAIIDDRVYVGPGLAAATSFDKLSPAPSGDDESEAGSEDAGPTSTPPGASKKSVSAKKKGKTPKSKLAQEIMMGDYTEVAMPLAP